MNFALFMKINKKNYPILIVEDNAVSQALLNKMLTKVGHPVLLAQNGTEALKILRDKRIPIVITDWQMPQMDGLMLCKAIREKKTKGYVYVVLITAMSSKEDIITGLEAGADDYLTKPVNFTELTARLNAGIRILELERNLVKYTQKIKKLSIIDSLTKCYNRAYMIKSLNKEITRAKRYKHKLSLIFCDIDHFKYINDTYGHHTGDFVLKEVAKTIQSTIRKEIDILSRYGGEEFLIVLPETSPKEAFCLAERIRNKIAETHIETKNVTVKVSASFGVMGFDNYKNTNNITSNEMIKIADIKLYESKSLGRNRVSI